MHWANNITNYNLKLTYCPGLANAAANALSRKQDKLKTQKKKDRAARTRAFLHAEQISLLAFKALASNLASLAAKGLSSIVEIRATNTFIGSLPINNLYAVID